MLKRVLDSPVLVRVFPFAVIAGLTLLQSPFGDNAQYWVYAVKMALGAAALWLVRPYIKEMRWTFSWEAVGIGVLIFIAWVGLDGHYPMLASRKASFNPFDSYGEGSLPAYVFVSIRILGSSLLIPPIEEVFYRSFVYRYMMKSDFLKVPLGHFEWRSFLITGVIFGASHYEWLPGIFCAFAYQWLVCRKNRLGDALTAHAITNLLLGIWVVSRQAYHFW